MPGGGFASGAPGVVCWRGTRRMGPGMGPGMGGVAAAVRAGAVMLGGDAGGVCTAECPRYRGVDGDRPGVIFLRARMRARTSLPRGTS